MDFYEFTKIIVSRIHKFEPENATKIIGCLMLKEPGEQEMMELAFGPEHAIHSLINDAKATLSRLSPKPANSVPFQPIHDIPHQFTSPPAGNHPLSSHATFRPPNMCWDLPHPSEQQSPNHNLDYVPYLYPDSNGEHYPFRNQAQFLSFEEQLDPMNPMGSDFSSNYDYHESALGGGLTSRVSKRSSNLPEFPKACHYFYKGYCKHGSSCKYFHGQSIPEAYSQLYSQNMNELANEEYAFSPGSLEKLEEELTELLKARRGMPVSIASLPMMYFEKYGKTIQADGYLTESQRHGKAGYSLTKLLARLKNSIRLIDRPHGQHSVILAEDAHRYMEYRSERCDPDAIVTSSHQIYLTFPAESTFTEEDVSNYFARFGPVRDVRIPCQQKRMFGFVSFEFPQTVKTILMTRNPHYIHGARVLVKPYREKTRIVERTYMDKVVPAMYYPSQYLEMDPELHAITRECDRSRLLEKQLIEEHEKVLELERRRLSEFNLVPKPNTQQRYFGSSMEEFSDQKGSNEFSLTDHFSYTLDVLNNGSTSDDRARNMTNGYTEHESSQIDLPESPFASPPVGSSISTALQRD